MGCDSHPCIEVRRRNGKWGLIDTKHKYYKLLDREGANYEDVEKAKPSFIRVLGDRDYDLFAVLADTRNYVGAKPLFAGRGFPEDVSKATVKEIPEDSDYHSHTHFTVQELIDAPWEKTACKNYEVILYADQFQTWKETGKLPEDFDPLPYEEDEFTHEVTEHEMTLLLMAESVKKLARKGRRQGRRFSTRYGPYVKIRTKLNYKQLVPRLFGVIDDLKKIGDPEDVRVVIAFDN